MMMKLLPSLFLSLFLLLAASCNKKVADVVATPPKLRPAPSADTLRVDNSGGEEPEIEIEEPEIEDIVIELLASLQKTPCYGSCPVFEVKYYSDGRISYHGKQNAKRAGIYEAWGDENFRAALNQLVRKYNYFNFEEEYPVSGREITDLPSTITFLSMDGRQKQVTNNYESPLALRKFEEELEALFDGLQWTLIKSD